ncbi:MAG: DNA-protecting protein DprA [Armatimonadetes bacterium]|nr:DNA-protecting protein DprA [Armatimonadota bacterium]
MMKKIKAWIKLLETPEIGNAKAIRLTEILGEPKNFIGKPDDRLTDIDFISESAKENLAKGSKLENWDKIAELMETFEIKFISILDKDYPTLLKSIYTPPPFLFYRGKLDKDIFRRTIAIVGTRKPTNYGKIMTKRIGSKLVQAGFTIVSGLAYGIDTIAHLSTFENNGRTIAVLGTGCDQIYPPINREIAEKIIETGALISEYLPGQKVEKWNFPTRNRIISGISLGSLIIEGSKKSGALLTAKFALDQNRDVFALPGDINREQSAGPNYLIKLGAKIVTCPDDILEEYDLVLDRPEKPFPKLSEKEDNIYQVLLENKPEIQFDDLMLKTGYSVGELSTVLLSLELKSIIKKVPGNKIVPLY